MSLKNSRLHVNSRGRGYIEHLIRVVFIRVPAILEVGEGVEVLVSNDGKPVAVRQESIYGTTFHPELSGNTVFHEDSV